MPAPRGISQAATSFFGSRYPGIHRTPYNTYNNTHPHTTCRHRCSRPLYDSQPPRHHHTPPPTRAHGQHGHSTQTPDSMPVNALPQPQPTRTTHAARRLLPRKEVIQPHLPVRLPCYDFVPIANPTFDHSPHHKVVRPWASGVTNFRDVTGGVYKARERIHRGVADPRLLATPTSRGRVADPDPN